MGQLVVPVLPLSDALKAWREGLDISVREAARIFETSPTAFYMWESGKRTPRHASEIRNTLRCLTGTSDQDDMIARAIADGLREGDRACEHDCPKDCRYDRNKVCVHRTRELTKTITKLVTQLTKKRKARATARMSATLKAI